MGLNLDLSAITPGPGGTTMLGEGGGIEAAARRGRERIRQREAAQAAAAMNDSMSEATLVPGSEAAGQQNQPAQKKTQAEPSANESSREDKNNGSGRHRVRDWMRRNMMP